MRSVSVGSTASRFLFVRARLTRSLFSLLSRHLELISPFPGQHYSQQLSTDQQTARLKRLEGGNGTGAESMRDRISYHNYEIIVLVRLSRCQSSVFKPAVDYLLVTRASGNTEFILSHVSGHLVNQSLIFTRVLALFLISTNSQEHIWFFCAEWAIFFTSCLLILSSICDELVLISAFPTSYHLIIRLHRAFLWSSSSWAN